MKQKRKWLVWDDDYGDSIDSAVSFTTYTAKDAVKLYWDGVGDIEDSGYVQCGPVMVLEQGDEMGNAVRIFADGTQEKV